MSGKLNHLPINEKFEFYFDEEGDYVIHISRWRNGKHELLTADGKTPNEAVDDMIQVLITVMEMDENK